VNRSLQLSAAVAGAVALVLLSQPPGVAQHGREPGRSAAVPCQVVHTQSTPKEVTTGSAYDPSVLAVAETGVLTDVDVQVGVTHPNDGEVDLTLFRPGHVIRLVTGVGGTDDNFTDTVFDDSAATSITAGTAPFTGRYQPVDPLGVLAGSSAQGSWELLARDASTGPGTLNYWRVILTFATCDLDDDGVEDHQDACLGEPASLASGCPKVDRKVSLSYEDGRFRGRISSDLRACEKGQKVTVWQVRAGADRKVGSDRSDRRGRFAVLEPRRAGTFYARVPGLVVPEQGECRPKRSPRLQVSP
jgi:subtilisin-like proprotein convertase family protein